MLLLFDYTVISPPKPVFLTKLQRKKYPFDEIHSRFFNKVMDAENQCIKVAVYVVKVAV